MRNAKIMKAAKMIEIVACPDPDLKILFNALTYSGWIFHSFWFSEDFSEDTCHEVHFDAFFTRHMTLIVNINKILKFLLNFSLKKGLHFHYHLPQEYKPIV
jgi:hypothetical protein